MQAVKEIFRMCIIRRTGNGEGVVVFFGKPITLLTVK